MRQEHDQTSLAYAAGLLDADGAFCVHLRRPRKGSPLSYPGFQPMIQIKQVDRPGIEFLMELFGGTATPSKASTPGGKPLVYWRVSGDKAAQVAELLTPYLRIKKRQAALLIELAREIRVTEKIKGPPRLVKNRWGHSSGASFRVIPPDSIERRKAITNQIRVLNDSRHKNPF